MNVFDVKDQIENIVFQVLAHQVRRTILKVIGFRPQGVSYSELIAELNISTGKLNYHLEQLEGMITKNDERRYVLTPFGKKALNQLDLLKTEVSAEDEKYVKIAEASQTSSMQPVLRWILLAGIAFSVMVIIIWFYIAYVAITEGAPIIVYVLLPIFIVTGFGLLGSLLLALKKTPNWIKRLERRLLGTT